MRVHEISRLSFGFFFHPFFAPLLLAFGWFEEVKNLEPKSSSE